MFLWLGWPSQNTSIMIFVRLYMVNPATSEVHELHWVALCCGFWWIDSTYIQTTESNKTSIHHYFGTVLPAHPANPNTSCVVCTDRQCPEWHVPPHSASSMARLRPAPPRNFSWSSYNCNALYYSNTSSHRGLYNG